MDNVMMGTLKQMVAHLKEEIKQNEKSLKALDECAEWNKRFSEEASQVSIENLEDEVIEEFILSKKEELE